MALLAEYKATLKSPAVEEPIDLWVHRPLAFIIAKLSSHTSITPNQLTALSMGLGCASGLFLFTGQPRAALVAAFLLFLSQVVDCSDGMLARMRRGGSELGRMLDGCADSFTMLFAVSGALYTMLQSAPQPHGWQALALIAATILTAYTSSLHTSGYDYFKNLYLRVTVPNNHEGEDVEHAVERWELARQGDYTLALSLVFPIYVGYLRAQRRMISWFDPGALVRLERLPAYDARAAQAFEREMRPLMTIWRSLFGVGSLTFGLALFIALGHVEIYLFYRLVFLNAVFFFYLMPAQRAASRRALDAIVVTRPSPEDADRLLHA
ncbi:MAG: CDP-alcohol phosphatidyltransferase family protein [Polyangiaceae bacterium]